MDFKSKLLQELVERGIIKDIIHPEKLEEKLLNNEKICLYAGFDMTADSLHAGNLVVIKTLQIFQKYGHKIIIIFGGATTKIGDPSGKDEMRNMKTLDEIKHNKEGIIKSISKFITINENVIFLDNDDWMSKMSYIDFLQNVGSYFSINKMIKMESVKLRLDRESHLSFVEFNYMLLQAYDFYHLWEEFDCCMQIGGSEQWGNIVNGIDLINKKSDKKGDIFGLTINLITRSDGKKMGKSESGAVWLNEEKMPPFEYYQYFRNIPDEDVEKFLLLFTNYRKDDIIEIQKQDINMQKQLLALEATKECHGIENAYTSKERSIDEFKNKTPTQILKHHLQVNENIVDILYNLKLFESKSECKKVIQGGGVSINNIKIMQDYVIKYGEFNLKIGKKKLFLLKLI